jgi:hypothetical protein
MAKVYRIFFLDAARKKVGGDHLIAPNHGIAIASAQWRSDVHTEYCGFELWHASTLIYSEKYQDERSRSAR